MIDLLYRLARDLLDAGADVLAEGSRPVPERRVIETGTVINAPVTGKGTCAGDQLVVVSSGLRLSPVPPLTSSASARARRPSAMVWSTTLTLCLHRCHAPSLKATPSPQESTDAAGEWMLDGWQLARGLAYRWRSQTLLPSLGSASPAIAAAEANNATVTLGDGTPVNPQSGIAGWSFPVTLLLPDIYTAATAADAAAP